MKSTTKFLVIIIATCSRLVSTTTIVALPTNAIKEKKIEMAKSNAICSFSGGAYTNGGRNAIKDDIIPSKAISVRVVDLIRSSLEATMYGTIYAFVALHTSGWVERLFPTFDDSKLDTYTWFGLVTQISLQAGANCAFAHQVRMFIKHLPLPDIDGNEKALPAANGGIIFAFLMFSRQNNWRDKVSALGKILEKEPMF